MLIDTLVFDEQTHTYFFQGKQLSGITGLLKKSSLSSGENLPDRLAIASVKGKKIHKAVEIALKTRRLPKDEDALWCIHSLLLLYPSLSSMRVDSELLVSDFVNFASAVDIVVHGRSFVDIFDIKTGNFDADYCASQLGFYVWLLKVSRNITVRYCYVLATKDRTIYPICPISEKEIRVILRRNGYDY